MEQNEGWNAALRGIFAEYAGASHQHDKTTMGAVRILKHIRVSHTSQMTLACHVQPSPTSWHALPSASRIHICL